MSEVGLRMEGVCHAYGRHRVVADLSLEVGAGEIVCLLGPSGCGKSTVLRIAAGIEPLQQGRVIIGDRVVADERTAISPEGRRVGLVFQDYALFPHLSVLDNVAFGVRAPSPDKRYAIARGALGQVGLAAQAQAYPHTLSGGEQQRVALARALAPRPDVMLLDEPFASLDGRLRDLVRDDTVAILKAAGTPTVLVTHDPDEAMLLADRIAVMCAGRLIQVGTPSVIYNQPATSFVARFLSETNELKGVIKNSHVDTELGRLATGDGLAEGRGVEVLIRPEAIRLEAPGQGGIEARVRASRMIGPHSRIELEVANVAAPLIARAAPAAAPPSGAVVAVALDPHQVFIFANDGLD